MCEYPVLSRVAVSNNEGEDNDEDTEDEIQDELEMRVENAFLALQRRMQRFRRRLLIYLMELEALETRVNGGRLMGTHVMSPGA